MVLTQLKEKERTELDWLKHGNEVQKRQHNFLCGLCHYLRFMILTILKDFASFFYVNSAGSL